MDENLTLEQPISDMENHFAVANDEKTGNDLQSKIGSKFGKFKTVEGLMAAYENLEKEFTKKSQILSEMFKKPKVDNADENTNNNSENAENIKNSVVLLGEGDDVDLIDNPNSPMKSKDENKVSAPTKNWKEQLDNFLEKNQDAKAFSKEIAKEVMENKELENMENGWELAFNRVLAKKYKSSEQLVEDEDFLNDYVYSSEKIKNKILFDYLAGVNTNKVAPIVLTNSSSSVAFSGGEQVKTLHDAKSVLEKMLLS